MNLAHKHDSPQGEVIEFPKHERQDMSKKDEGYTRVPNSLIDEQIMAQLSDKAFKCLMLIIRQTTGFNKASNKIATIQFQELCGIKKSDKVYASIKELEQKNLIKVERKTGGLNTYILLENQSLNKVVPNNGTTPKNGEGTTPKNGDTTKENIKENFKENMCGENQVDSVLKLWTPEIQTLNAWLQRSGIAKMTQQEIDSWLIEINGYYSTKIESGSVTETQMYSNFVKWIKRSFTTRKSAPQQQIDSRNVNQAWANVQTNYEPVEPVELEDWML
ncbi:replication protein [Acinetobacter junii]|uniref:replication protein n=1 Tax=Acinetobacter junii TaxID=40215 RepID=UPI003C16C88E